MKRDVVNSGNDERVERVRYIHEYNWCGGGGWGYMVGVGMYSNQFKVSRRNKQSTVWE